MLKVYYLNLNKSAEAWQALCTQVLLAALFYLLGTSSTPGTKQKVSPRCSLLGERPEKFASKSPSVSHSCEEVWKPVVHPPLRTETGLMPLWWAVCNFYSPCAFHSTPVGRRAEIRSVKSYPYVMQRYQYTCRRAALPERDPKETEGISQQLQGGIWGEMELGLLGRDSGQQQKPLNASPKTVSPLFFIFF